MSECVVDASAVIAFLFNERGSDIVRSWMEQGAAISTVNVQEVLAKLVRDGSTPDEALEDLSYLSLDVFDFTLTDAAAASGMIRFTRKVGLSAGDRCCLALGQRLGLPVVHAEHRWQEVEADSGVRMVLIRKAAS